MRELTYIDKKRGQLKGRFYELNTTFKKDPPRHVLCSIDEYLYRPDGKKRSEKELQNYATRLYLEKLQSLKEARKIKMEKRNEDLIQKKKGPLIRDVMQDWIKTEVEINCKKLTVKEYLRSCSLYIDIVGDHPIQTFRKHHSISYKSGLDDMQLSDSGIKKHQTHLQIFLNWAYSEEYIEKPIRINKVRITKKSPVIYNSDEINLIQSVIEKAIYDSPDSYRKKFAENHLRAFMLARYAVMRNGEILSMPLRNLLIDEGVIQITEVPEIPWTPKTRQERIIPISPELNKFLIKDLKKRDSSEKWFLDNGGGSLAYSDKSQLSQVFRRYINRTGLNVPGRKPLHAFRSSGITGMLSNGGKLEFVMKIAGHSNPQTTLNHYVRAENFDLRETMNLVSDN